MRREDRFVQSHAPYAVDLLSLRTKPGNWTPTEPPVPRSWWGTVNAVWFRRRKGVTVACLGTLSDLQPDRPADARAFLSAHEDGRYGGAAWARWDGQTFWTNPSRDTPVATPEVANEWYVTLAHMLNNHPAAPEGYDGWWTFKGARGA